MSESSRITSIWPDSNRLVEHGLDHRLTFIPTLVWAGNRTLPGEIYYASRKFMEVRAGLSSPSITYHPILEPRRSRYDAPETTKKVVGALSNFLSYCIRNRVSWRDIHAGHKADKPSLMHWAYSSLEGSCGQSAVSPGTVSIRFYYAQHFLWWAGINGHRPPYEPTGHNFVRGVRPQMRVEEMVGIPEEDDIRRWLKRVQERFDWQAYLMIRLGLEVGLRSSETRHIRASKIPQKSVLQGGGYPTSMGILGDPAMDIFEVEIGAEDGTKYGKQRTIWVSKDLMISLQAWARLKRHRPLAMKLFSRKHPNSAKPVYLFFNPKTGRPWGKNHINNDIIKETEIIDGLGTTHKLRHYFASRFMLRHTVRAMRIAGSVSGNDAGSLLDHALNEAELQLQMQMGHSHGSTTRVYRNWAKEQYYLHAYARGIK